MQDFFNRYLMIVRRWAWVIVLGVVVCGGITYVMSRLIKPTYQATVIFVVTTDPTNALSSISAAPTYAQLVTNPLVLNPVVTKHEGMTLKQLNAMITVKPQMNTQLIELDVQSSDPRLAAQVVNEVGQSYLHYAVSQLSGTIQMLPAQVPSEPIKPQPLQDAGIGALVGLGLAVTLIVVFEWIEDRLSSPEDVQKILAQELLTVIPQLSEQRKSKGRGSGALVEGYRILAASLNTVQAIQPFKVVMVTSALPGEGKSTVAVNLASFLAMTGRKVLLIDADLHDPVLDQRFQVDNSQGFSTVLERWSSPSLDLYEQETDISTLRILTSGPVISDFAELLQSSLAQQLFNYLQEAPFDYVVVDAPPLLPVADAQFLASLVQKVLLVVDAHKTPRRALLRTKHVLERNRAKVLGIALNKSLWLDYEVSRQYPDKKTQSPEQLRLFKSATFSPSLSVVSTPPLMPRPGSRNSPHDTLYSPIHPSPPENGVVSNEQANYQGREQSVE